MLPNRRVPHYWIVDPASETLVVYRREDAGSLAATTAKKGEVGRAEPFEALPFPVGILFGEDEPES